MTQLKFVKLAFALVAFAASAGAQETLPKVDVTAPHFSGKWGGYLISNDFSLDTHMSAVVYPNEPFEQDDIIKVQTINLRNDDYFVLQECVSQDCTQGMIDRVWNFLGPVGGTSHNVESFRIPHGGKYFLWMQRFSMSGNGGTFTNYERFSPPLVLNPMGSAEDFQRINLKAAQEAGPVKVDYATRDGDNYVIHYQGGSSVMVQRLRSAN